ncbi:hypothetical protein FJZ26_02425 [Candidatus Parvarchaeota archaeon]|nr:hypothetical protein [Candidatus Parvarchaeota archaeon]
MRDGNEIGRKINELKRANSKKRVASPQREDIISALKSVLRIGKFKTLRDWEAKNSELAKLENEIVNDKSIFRFLRRGFYGEIIPDHKIDSLSWKTAAYSWALKIKSPVSAMLPIQIANKKGKKKEKRKEKA